jgi:hypothetical protein
MILLLIRKQNFFNEFPAGEIISVDSRIEIVEINKLQIN